MATGSLTALQLDAGAGLLQNQGIGINANLISAITSYETTGLIAPFLNTISTGAGNVLANSVISDLETLASNTCSALSNSIPPGYSSLGVQMTAVNQADAYTSQTSVFINSGVNSQTYLGNTFTNMNNMITGSVTAINLATGPFGTDLQNLGLLINLQNLNNFGSPLALVQQLYAVSGTIPAITLAFVAAGVPQDVVLNLNNPAVSVIDSAQRLMYVAMTQITGDDLAQILQVLGVTTVGIQTLADLLNPLKLFPNSFQSLTAPTKYGPVAIYVNPNGSVNTTLTTQLPPYVLSSLV